MAHFGESPRTECAQAAQVLYAPNCRQEQELLKRIELIKVVKPLTRNLAVIEPAALRVQLLAQQLKSLCLTLLVTKSKSPSSSTFIPGMFLFRPSPGVGPGWTCPQPATLTSNGLWHRSGAFQSPNRTLLFK